jgi:hypothetical protein
MMRVSFVRTQGSPDRIYVQRSDGGETSWSFPTYGDEVPHDLVHLVVEAAFGLKRGIWARVDEGADLARINAQANRMGGPNKYAALGEDQRELYLSEALAAVPWLRPELSVGDPASSIREACARSGVDVPASLTPARMDEVRAKLSALRERWRKLVPKGALVLLFDPALPEQSFCKFGLDDPEGEEQAAAMAKPRSTGSKRGRQRSGSRSIE